MLFAFSLFLGLLFAFLLQVVGVNVLVYRKPARLGSLLGIHALGFLYYMVGWIGGCIVVYSCGYVVVSSRQGKGARGKRSAATRSRPAKRRT